MKKMVTVLAALAILGNCSKASAMPMPEIMDDSRYQHEIMVGTNDNELTAEDGNVYVIEGIDHVKPIAYEVCVDTYCTDIREDDEIVDFVPLTEVLEVHPAYVLQDGNELVIADDSAESGHIYGFQDVEIPEYSLVYVIMNTHWSDDVAKHTIYGFTDMETYECYLMDGMED